MLRILSSRMDQTPFKHSLITLMRDSWECGLDERESYFSIGGLCTEALNRTNPMQL